MRTSWFAAAIALFLLVPVTMAQVDLVWTNTSGTSGQYGDSIALASTGGVVRPLAQHPNNSGGGTGFILSKPIHINVLGVDYLYWTDANVDLIYRGTDQNGNGVIDPPEFEIIGDAALLGGTSIQNYSLAEMGGTLAMSIDFQGTGVGRGVWLLTDMNGDGDFFDAGEATEVINGGLGATGHTITVGAVITSSDDIECVDFLSDGDLVWGDDDDKGVFYRWDSATATNSLWLNYDSAAGAAAGLWPQNPDFGVTLPKPGSITLSAFEDVDQISVDTTTDTVYIAENFEDDEAWIYRCLDLTGNGDVNEAGEVTLFWNGNTDPTFSGLVGLDDIKWFGGSLYVSLEDGPFTGLAAGHVIQLTDLNGDGDAMDAGELVIIHSLPAGDDPTVNGFTVVTAGAFDVPGFSTGCVRFSLDDNGIDSAVASTLTFTFNDIPATALTGADLGFVALSLTGNGGTSLGANCVLGLDLDFFSNLMLLPFFLPNFSTGPIIADGATTAGLALPVASFPAGFNIYYAGVIIGPGAGAGGIVASQSRVITVQ